MKEINIHKNNSLCSVKSIENNYSDRLYFCYLLERILKISNLVIIQVRRPYCKADDIVSKINNISEKINHLKVANQNMSLSFSYEIVRDNEDFIEVCSELWFEYEQPSFCFFIEKISANIVDYILDNPSLAWYDITKLSSCFTIFRGVEDDVVWIGKHEYLVYDMILKI